MRRLAIIVLTCEVVVTAILLPRFRLAYDDDLPTALWHAGFHAVSAFNNAGFALYSDSLVGFVADPWVTFPLCAAVIVGGLGFPVMTEIVRISHKWWSVHSRLTIYGTLVLLVIRIVGFGIAEWTNPSTIGGLDAGGKVMASVTGGVMPRTAGFNSIDYGAATPESLMFTNVLMFIGRVGVVTVGAALALSHRRRRYTLPEERIIVG